MSSSSSSKNLLRLYGYYQSGCSYRIRIALNLANVPYEDIPVNLLNGEQKSEKYEKLTNGQNLVPVLEVVDEETKKTKFTMSQSLTILEFLSEENICPGLLPETSDIASRQKCREICNIVACDTQPLQNLRVQKHIREVWEKDPIPWAKLVVERGYQACENLLAAIETSNSEAGGPHPGMKKTKYCFSDQKPTMADICLIAQWHNAIRFGIDVETQYPRVFEKLQNLIGFEAVKKAHPFNQVDCPEEMKKDGWWTTRE
ncbi:unnamed protein product [Amoebophrya sp. A120]|nr:unnamed protein product [Amoebophrya sp. A120]|eukprot:GSA120T00022217001.1